MGHDRARDLARFLDDLNHTFEKLHTAKEDAFWASYMGLGGDVDAARTALDEREIELRRFLTDPDRLRAVQARVAGAEAAARANGSGGAPTETQRIALRGWLSTFRAHVIPSAAARRLAEEIVEDEGRLARARGAMRLGYDDPHRGFLPASSVRLSMLVDNDPDPAVRRAAWEGLRDIEHFVLDHGFLDLVRKRNRLGRMLGGEDYYDAVVRRVEGLTKEEIFASLDDLEGRTRDAAGRTLDAFRSRSGAAATDPWNLRWYLSGDVRKEQDPYFPFADALGRWGRSFAALGIGFRGATLVLDLVDREGKHENGFMHGPVPAWRERGKWRPARIQLATNAIPGMVGSGRRAIHTLFHEGGHAAHFANIDMPAPCFAQEFAPTSVAFCETQSMLLESLVGDADWKARYALTRGGEAMPFALIEKGIRAIQPHRSWNVRAKLAICYAERAIYEIPDRELSAEKVLETIRDVERRLTLLPQGSPRPALSIPHYLGGESSAYYHGYVLAEMAVYQTRRYFLERDGRLCDNPAVGPDLCEAYWKPGNSLGFHDFVLRLTGRPLSGEAMARRVNRSADEEVALARQAVDRIAAGGKPPRGPVRLDAKIRVMDGPETIATGERKGFEACAKAFAGWIERRTAAPVEA